MVKYMGKPDLKSILYAMGFGTASTSCSFGDIAATKGLYKKGAHIVPSIAFLIASTNFVIGLSFVIWVLLGWEFVVAEAIGAPIFIFIATALVRLTISDEAANKQRKKLVEEEEPVVTCPTCKMRINRKNGIPYEYKHETFFFCTENCRTLFDKNPETYTASLKEKIKSWNGWVDAANQTLKDLRMLWKELAIGFLLAGIVGAGVPDQIWKLLFEPGGGGIMQTFYNSFLGPLISLATFVGSIGNVPLASVLWSSGFAFAGVIAFIYADLIVPQLIRIYRKIFGKKIGNKISIILYVSMALTGVIVYSLFEVLGII